MKSKVFESVKGKIAQCVPRGFGRYLRQPEVPHVIDCEDMAPFGKQRWHEVIEPVQ